MRRATVSGELWPFHAVMCAQTSLRFFISTSREATFENITFNATPTTSCQLNPKTQQLCELFWLKGASNIGLMLLWQHWGCWKMWLQPLFSDSRVWRSNSYSFVRTIDLLENISFSSRNQQKNERAKSSHHILVQSIKTTKLLCRKKTSKKHTHPPKGKQRNTWLLSGNTAFIIPLPLFTIELYTSKAVMLSTQHLLTGSVCLVCLRVCLCACVHVLGGAALGEVRIEHSCRHGDHHCDDRHPGTPATLSQRHVTREAKAI